MSRQREKQDKFAKLRELRQNRETNLSHYQVEEAKPVYDIVTEHEFNSLRKKLMLEDDFVVDDNGQGYITIWRDQNLVQS